MTSLGFRGQSWVAFEERLFEPTPPIGGGGMLRRKLNQWTTSGPTSGGWATAARNPRVTKQVNILLDTGTSNALTSTTTTSHDDDLNVVATNHYDFTSISQSSAQTLPIASISAGSLLRTDEATYLVNDTGINPTTRAAYRDQNLLRLVTSTRVKLGSTLVAQTQISYDETDTYPLLTYGGTIGGWNDPATNLRGLPTTTGVWLNITNSYLQSHAQYDQFGNVRNIWDAKGNQSQMTYSSAYSYAYPTAAVSAIPDPTGQHGSTTALSTSAEYNANTGLMTSLTDTNGQTTNYAYDAINRPATITRPSGGGSTSYAYGDVPGDLYVRTQTSLDTARVIEAYEYYDKLGRPCRSFLNEGSAYLTTDTQYDLMGRAWRTSNPYRTTSLTGVVNPGDDWTTSTYDYLGRVTAVTTPDNASVKTAYSGNRVLVADQNSSDDLRRKRISETNALGRLAVVWEITSTDGYTEDVSFPNWPSVTKGYKTTYEYDPLDNLTQVSQGGQSRTFAYDSLKRLTSATQAESGTVSYQYDNNGNLLVKTDARWVSAHYTYDALNRLQRRWYNGSSLLTDEIHNTPALPAGVGASDEVKYFYDSATLPSGAPSAPEFSRGYSTGRLVAVTYGGGSNGDYYEYDAPGRIELKIQRTGGVNYRVDPAYNLAGHVTSLTYPSNRTVTNTYDNAGRLSSFTGYLGDGTLRTYATGLSYSSFGGLTQEEFGTNTPLYHKKHYNIRGQLYDVRVSTASLAADEWNWNRGAVVLYYGGADWGQSSAANNGNVTMQQHWVPLTESVSNYVYTQQSYSYDALDRLSAVSELHGEPSGPTPTDFVQAYRYDRWGNRTIDYNATTPGIPRPEFDTTALPSTNRLYAPGDTALPMDQRQMRYDGAGNLKHDAYTGQGIRVYDAENKIVEAAGNGQLQYYSYDGDGRRVKRKVDQVENYQVYGLGGELLAEYKSNGTQLSKEYGYRNGELLITATITTGSGGSAFSFSDDPLVVGTTAVKAAHFTELRTAIDQARVHAGLSAASWGEPITAGVTTIKASHVTELRTRLDEARTALGLSTGGYTDPGLANGYDIKATHISQLRTKANEALTTGGGTSLDLRWLVSDHLGTPRMILDQTGTLANVSRLDYLPFGEEVPSNFRTGIPGYTASDGVRQKFTSKERDNETGLDYFGARYYASTQGRFTSPDPLLSSGRPIHPQSWNRYSYVINHPLSLIDPDGLDWGVATWYDKEKRQWIIDYHYFTGEVGSWNGHEYSPVNFGNDSTRTLDLSDGRTVVISNDPDALGGAYMRDITARPQAEQEPVLPPSWMDHVPVLARGRQFLFNYNTQNFEGATVDFIVLSAELGTISVAGPATVARSLATRSGQAIFYSGRGTMQLATQAARTEGGKLITDTAGGAALKFLTKPLPERLAGPIWNWGSKHFAQGASGSVRAFIREPLRNNSTWAQVEYPILRVNPFVRITPR